MVAPKLEEGYIEIPHRADLALRIWACDRLGIFRQSAKGLYSLMGIGPEIENNAFRSIYLVEIDDESLLISFLNELINDMVLHHSRYKKFNLTLERSRLEGELFGSKVFGFAHEVKAATYSDIKIHKSRLGYTTRIVFDV